MKIHATVDGAGLVDSRFAERLAAELSAAKPRKAKLIRWNDDGSALVDVPIAVETAVLRLERTHGGGKGESSITPDDLRQMVANFPKWGKPVTVGFDGIDGGHDRDKGGPARAYVEGLRVVGDALIATVHLSADVAGLILDGGYRGSSMEGEKNPRTPTGDYDGWVLRGFTFTNAPAIDTVFKIAASGDVQSDAKGVVLTPLQFNDRAGSDEESGNEEFQMSKEVIEAGSKETGIQGESISLSFHETKLSELRAKADAANDRVKSLTETVETQREQIRNLRSEADEAKAKMETAKDDALTEKAAANRALTEAKNLREANRQLQETVSGLTEKVKEQETLALAEKVTRRVKEAIDRKVRPAIFDGHEKDPSGWCLRTFADFDAFDTFCTSLEGGVSVPSGATVSAGKAPSEETSDADATLTEQDRARIEAAIGRKLTFGTVTNEEEARKRFLASKKD